MNKRGQTIFGMSFSMIFSVILIAVVLAVGFFVIAKFLNLGSCTDTGLLYDGLQDEVDKAWRSTIYQGFYEEKLPSGITHVCFGDLDSNSDGVDRAKQSELREEFVEFERNVYLYPFSKSCDVELASTNIERVEIGGFFCIEGVNGKLKVKLSKGSGDSLVKIEDG